MTGCGGAAEPDQASPADDSDPEATATTTTAPAPTSAEGPDGAEGDSKEPATTATPEPTQPPKTSSDQAKLDEVAKTGDVTDLTLAEIRGALFEHLEASDELASDQATCVVLGVVDGAEPDSVYTIAEALLFDRPLSDRDSVTVETIYFDCGARSDMRSELEGFLVEDAMSPEEASCIVTFLVEQLGMGEVLRMRADRAAYGGWGDQDDPPLMAAYQQCS